MATIIISIDSDREEDVRDLAEAVEHVARLVTFQTVVRTSLTDEAAFRSDAIRTAGSLWSGTSYKDAEGSEYLRGQVETIADTFGFEGDEIPREEIAREILTARQTVV